MPNKFSPTQFKKLFSSCKDISEQFELIDESWSDRGNFGAIYRCRYRRNRRFRWEHLQDLADLPYKELIALAPPHCKALKLNREELIAKIWEMRVQEESNGLVSSGRQRTDSMASITAESSEDEIFVVKIIPLDGSTGAFENNHWMTAGDAFSEEQKLSRIALLCSVYGNDLLQTPKIRAAFRSEEALFLVMDFIDGKTLSRLVSEEGFFSNQRESQKNFPATADLTLQVVQNLLRLHAIDLIHLDIKPENIMRSLRQADHDSTREVIVKPASIFSDATNTDDDFSSMFTASSNATSESNDVKTDYLYTIVDFGMCTKVEPTNNNSSRRVALMPPGRGTRGFIAPEIEQTHTNDIIDKASSLKCASKSHVGDAEVGLDVSVQEFSAVPREDEGEKVAYTPACDCWSLGATLYYVITNSMFDHYAIHQRLGDKSISAENRFREKCTLLLRELVGNRSLTYVSREDPGYSAKKANANMWTWEESPFQLIFKLTEDDEQWRMTIEQAISHPFLHFHRLGFTEAAVEREKRSMKNTARGVSQLPEWAQEAVRQRRSANSDGPQQQDEIFRIVAMSENQTEANKEKDKDWERNHRVNKMDGRLTPSTPDINKHVQTNSGSKLHASLNDGYELQRSKSWNAGEPHSYSSKINSGEKRSKWEERGHELKRSHSTKVFDADDASMQQPVYIRTSSRNSFVSRSDTSSEKGTDSGQLTPQIISRGSSNNNLFSANSNHRKPSELEKMQELIRRKDWCGNTLDDLEKKLQMYSDMISADMSKFHEELSSAQQEIFLKCESAYNWTQPGLPEYVKKKLWVYMESISASGISKRPAAGHALVLNPPNLQQLEMLIYDIKMLEWKKKREEASKTGRKSVGGSEGSAALKLDKQDKLEKLEKLTARAFQKCVRWLDASKDKLKTIYATRSKIENKYDKKAFSTIQVEVTRVKKLLCNPKKDLDTVVELCESQVHQLSDRVREFLMHSSLPEIVALANDPMMDNANVEL